MSTNTELIKNQVIEYVKEILKVMPSDWAKLTTHRLDIYNEELAKVEFLEKLEQLFDKSDSSQKSLLELPTAFDYIRLGHPLSCVLEWLLAKFNNLPSNNVISFSSNTMPIMAVLRKNHLTNKKTKIAYDCKLPSSFDVEAIKSIYGYQFDLEVVESIDDISTYNGDVLFVTQNHLSGVKLTNDNIDFVVNYQDFVGSVIFVSDPKDELYISEIQHVRRRESIAMTPFNSLLVLNELVKDENINVKSDSIALDKLSIIKTISEITNSNVPALIASSGLSIQYAILMGLLDESFKTHPNKKIKIIVPPNCYGGTNDQARRVAAGLKEVEVLDLPVDGGEDMAVSIERILTQVAKNDEVPLIIAEIPTNPRVEVPSLKALVESLNKNRKTLNNDEAVKPVFILDQTFCPNVKFLGDDDIFSNVQTISYVSGSKFPSGGQCTAGYCVANKKAKHLIDYIGKHLSICDNEATIQQLDILKKQMPSMIQRIEDAYINTRDFVNFIQNKLPEAKINFVSKELALKGFTPSVFSLDLPTKGENKEEREVYKRKLNLKLINLMIDKIPSESKYCVSYGQLKGCYWTIPATSTQGTTKEGDKDYIVRVAVSGNLDLDLHKKVFSEFCDSI